MVSVADHPDIFPIDFVVDHGTVVFRTAGARNWPRRSSAPMSPLKRTVMNPIRGRRGVLW